MASGRTDNLMTAILAHGRDPVSGEYLTAAQRKELFKKSKISGSKVFGGGGGRGNVRGGGGGRTGGLAGGALALRDPGAITNNDIAQKLDNIYALLKADADSERRYKEASFERQRQTREKLLRGSAENSLEGKDKNKAQKVEKAKKGMQVQIPFLEKLAKFLMIYLAGWTTDKLINMFSAKAEGNIAKFLEYRDVLIQQLGKFFTPVANIANGFAIWIAKTTGRIAKFAARVGNKLFSPFFKKVRDIAVGMLNRLKNLVQKPLQTAAEKLLKPVLSRGQQLLERGKEAVAKSSKGLTERLSKLTKPAAKFMAGVGKRLNPKELLSRAFSPIKNLLGSASGPLTNGLKKFVGGNLLGMVLGAGFDVRQRLIDGQSPTQAFLAGIIKGAASGAIAGTVTSALSAAIPGLGLPLGLLLGGYLGEKGGELLAGPIDNYFAKKTEPNDFDKWFTNWANNSDDSVKALLGWDNRQANPKQTPPKAPENGKGKGGGMGGNMTSGASGVPASSLTPSRGSKSNFPAVIPMGSESAQPPQQIPNKSLVTNIPVIEPTNNDNPYLAFSYSVYNVLV